jgi:hypothetical protein
MNKYLLFLIIICIIFVIYIYVSITIYKSLRIKVKDVDELKKNIDNKTNEVNNITAELENIKTKSLSDYDNYKYDLDKIKYELSKSKENNAKLNNNLTTCKNKKVETVNTNVDDIFKKSYSTINDDIKNNKFMVDNYKFVGCYNLNTNTFNKNLIGNNLTIYNCVKQASDKKYKYFGYKNTNKTDIDVSIDFTNNKLSTSPLAVGDCYGENDIDLTKEVTSNNCVSQHIYNTGKIYDMVDNQIVNTSNTKDKYPATLQPYVIDIPVPPVGTKDSISIFTKTN